MHVEEPYGDVDAVGFLINGSIQHIVRTQLVPDLLRIVLVRFIRLGFFG
jgi:hypothetical protein